MMFGIVISTYQRPDGKTPSYLKRLLSSVFSQFHGDFTVFIVGDDYKDVSELLNVVSSYPKEKIHIDNLGVAVEREKYKKDPLKLWCSGGVNATNFGIKKSLKHGISYVCCVDHDDYWNKNHLKVINNVVEKERPDWLCTKSTYGADRILPQEVGKGQFLPLPGGVVKSSVCMNMSTIPLHYRDVFAETGEVCPSDADLWHRCRTYIQENKLRSCCIDEVTCYHEEEGYVLRGKERS